MGGGGGGGGGVKNETFAGKDDDFTGGLICEDKWPRQIFSSPGLLHRGVSTAYSQDEPARSRRGAFSCFSSYTSDRGIAINNISGSVTIPA